MGRVGIEQDYPVSIKEVLDITAETGALITQSRVRELKPYCGASFMSESRMKFSIIRKIDTQLLNNQLHKWEQTNHGYNPIILLSPDTLRDMPRLDEYRLESTNNNCTGMVGMYQGYKVFSDPTMCYGEVELR